MADKEASLLIRIKEAGAESLSMISGGLKAIGVAAAAAFAVVSAVVTKSISEYAQAEKATNTLNQALVQQGMYSKALKKDYDDLADSLSKKSLYQDNEITQAQAAMQMYLGQTKITKELMQATLDLAAAKGIDLKTAAELVGKSIGTSTNALARQGIALADGATKAEKMAQVTEKLTRSFGGQAEAQTKGLGSLVLMQNAFGEIFEVIGKELQPVIVYLAQSLTALAQNLQTNRQFLDAVKFSIQTVAQVGIVLYNILAGLGELIGGGLATQMLALTQLMNGNFKQAFETVKSGAASLQTDLVNRFNKTYEDLDALDKMFLQKKQENIVAEETLIRQSNENKIAIQQEHNAIKDEMFTARSAEEIDRLIAYEELKTDTELAGQLARLNNEQQTAATKTERLEAEYKKRKMLDDAYYNSQFKLAVQRNDMEAVMESKRFKQAESSLSYMSKMQDSKNKELVAIGKAAAIAKIGIDTAQAIMGVWGWAAAIPFVGPIIATGLTAAILGYGAESISRVNSQQMATGGIVTARPGGMLATIGEGGSDEAVIPLDDDRAKEMLGGGGGVTIVVNGGLLGDASSAREFARAVDEELFKLRQAGGSVAFGGRSV